MDAAEEESSQKKRRRKGQSVAGTRRNDKIQAIRNDSMDSVQEVFRSLDRS
jgi:hypothetical protein